MGPNLLASQSSVAIANIEVTQVVQTLRNDIPLVRNKATLVRLYVSSAALVPGSKLRGEIAIGASATSPVRFIPSINEIEISRPLPSVVQQRRDLALSLNFLLPAEVIAWPTLSITASWLTANGAQVAMTTNPRIDVTLEVGPPLRIKAVGFRYAIAKAGAPSDTITPAALHFDYLRSFLGRAYPVSGLVWSQIVVQADPRITPPFDGVDAAGNDVWMAQLAIAHNQLSAIRAKDVDAGQDPRTHYYGLISDADRNLFFRGAAKDIPQVANPAVVAVGPVGNPRNYPKLRWDTDASYGDWYGAHELAHTFGRFHPGFCDGQDASDPGFPYAEGLISNDGEDAIGVDVGDLALQLPTRLMVREICHDIMTYCDNQWMSPHSYRAIFTRLQEEDTAFAPVTS